jgi:uncharacterized protein
MHRCIKCGAEFRGDPEDMILKGCPDCGNKFFEYHKEDKVQDYKEVKNINKDNIREIKRVKGDSIETIMVRGHGIYDVNLNSLLEDESIIVSDEEGKYLIDINFLLKKKMKEKEKEHS